MGWPIMPCVRAITPEGNGPLRRRSSGAIFTGWAGSMRRTWPNRYFLGHGLGAGIKLMLENKNMGLGMLLKKRMKVLPERPIKNIKTLKEDAG